MKTTNELCTDKQVIEGILQKRRLHYSAKKIHGHEELVLPDPIGPQKICLMFKHDGSFAGASEEMIF